MTIKRIILSLLTVVAILFAGASLWESWQQPQIQSRLELYQANLLLHAQEWQPQGDDSTSLSNARSALLGEQPLNSALEQYQEARTSAQVNLDKANNQLKQLQSESVTTPATPKPQSEIAPVTNTSRPRQQEQLQQSRAQLQRLIAELDLRLGLLQVQQGQTNTAIQTWTNFQQQVNNQQQAVLAETATVLIGLWSDPPRIIPDAEQLLQNNLEGWFRYRALSQLYQIQQRQDTLTQLQATEQATAQQALIKLAFIGSLPAFGGIVGIGLLLFLCAQRLLKGKDALLAQNEDARWSTPWTGETIWQVFILGFFFMGQIVVPLGFALLQIRPPSGSGVRVQAFYILTTYLTVALGGLIVLVLSIKPFFPLPKNWFRFDLQGNWFLWGLGGYCAALPLVVIVSLINQQIWQGQGGSNPLLSLALQAQDQVALAIFFFTAAIAAPIFEELLFRGFLLPSLTRYMSVWGAIVLSSLLFAVAHLSVAEILPLTVLGMVLGVVYTRSRNLLAPMLLHSLWNSGTLLSLFILGSSST